MHMHVCNALSVCKCTCYNGVTVHVPVLLCSPGHKGP